MTDYGGGRAAEEGGALGSAGGDSPRSLIAGSEKSLNDVGEAGGSVETAVVALTKIVAELAKGKRGNSDKSGGLEAALDRAEGLASGSSDPSGGSSGSRSRAAAFRLLQNALKNEPEIIYTTIERLMSEDLLHSRQGTDLAATHASSRAWLEHRSHLGGYPTTVRLAWQMAGVFDALRADRVEARPGRGLPLPWLVSTNSQWTEAVIKHHRVSNSLAQNTNPNLQKSVAGPLAIFEIRGSDFNQNGLHKRPFGYLSLTSSLIPSTLRQGGYNPTSLMRGYEDYCHRLS